jgi:rRNA biogenesis protein RRP5
VWSAYLEFLIQMRDEPTKPNKLSEPKEVLQKALQALTKDQHVNMISKFGMLEFKSGNPEAGRTMFEGIVTNYPKRMDIWAIYMDMESKHGMKNVTQARHLFERCLSNDFIQKKPKKMKLVFQKYMEYESKQGNKNNIPDIKKRVEEYLSKFYDQANSESSDGEQSD